MKSFSFRILLISGFCFLFLTANIFAQKNKDQEKFESTTTETKVETKSSSDSSSSKSSSDSSSTSTSSESKSSSSSTSSTSYDSSSSDSGSSSSSSSGSSTAGKNDADRRNRREGQAREKERQRQEEERREKERRKKDDYCPYWDAYGNCSYYPINDSDSTTSTIDPSAYFGSNDISFIDFESYLESYEDRYLPYFENPLRLQYTPLTRISLIETSRDLPFYLSNWVLYYEPDLGNFFIDFSKLGQFKYDVLVLSAVGKTVKKANKKFKYKGDDLRPIMVEDISTLSNTSIYSFNLKELPKGDYEIKFISKDGNILKRQFTIK